MKNLLLALTFCTLVFGTATRASASEPADASPDSAEPSDPVAVPAVPDAPVRGPVVAPPSAKADGTADTAAPAAEIEPVGTAKQVITDVRAGNWRDGLAGVLALIMLGLAKIRGASWSPFKGDRGGIALLLLMSGCGTFSGALYSDAPIGFDLIYGALAAAVTAAGGYTIVKRLIWPAPMTPAAGS